MISVCDIIPIAYEGLTLEALKTTDLTNFFQQYAFQMEQGTLTSMRIFAIMNLLEYINRPFRYDRKHF